MNDNKHVASRLCAPAAGRGEWARWARRPPAAWARRARRVPTQATASSLEAAVSSLVPPGIVNHNVKTI